MNFNWGYYVMHTVMWMHAERLAGTSKDDAYFETGFVAPRASP